MSKAAICRRLFEDGAKLTSAEVALLAGFSANDARKAVFRMLAAGQLVCDRKPWPYTYQRAVMVGEQVSTVTYAQRTVSPSVWRLAEFA